MRSERCVLQNLGQLEAADLAIEFLQGLTAQPAEFAAAQAPIQSNSGFDWIAFALETITGATMEEVLNESLVNALHLNGTDYTVPKSAHHGVIPKDETVSTWNRELGVGNSSVYQGFSSHIANY